MLIILDLRVNWFWLTSEIRGGGGSDDNEVNRDEKDIFIKRKIEK